MSISSQIAKHFREIYFGENWTCVNYKNILADVNWQDATTPVNSFNTIATLFYHTGYYVSVLLKVLKGGPLNAKDEFSFKHPTIESQADWDLLLNTTFSNVELAASSIENITEQMLWENFTNEKYGNYYRNIHGIIEHSHYHLGQIVLIKKMLQLAAIKEN